MSQLSVAIVGASGYTGAELLRLLCVHPQVKIAAIFGHSRAGTPLSQVYPQFQGVLSLEIQTYTADAVSKAAEIAFVALPHGASARIVAELVAAGLRVIDLSADFRLGEAQLYEAWYASESEPHHPAPELFAEAVYGLPELYRDKLRSARLVAAPGCYPTSAILPLAPLLKAGLVESKGIVVDAKSGISGAGRRTSLATHFAEAGEGVRPYKVAGAHRHTPEMELILGREANCDVCLTFSPHLVPMSRGIGCNSYSRPTEVGRQEGALREALADAYGDEPFVQLLEGEALPDTSFVRGSNRIQIAVRYDARADVVVALSAIDNLCKGSSGQAIQCLNLQQGWDEGLGLGGAATFP